MKVFIRRRRPDVRPGKRVCLFVTSCRAPMGYERRKVCLDTWLSRIDNQYFDWYFVVGDENIHQQWTFDGKTMVCRARDDWWGLIYKTQLFCKYAWQYGYDCVVKADDDTYVNTELLKNRIEKVMRPNRYDVMAYMIALEGEQRTSGNWFPAGPLYCFSRNVVKLIATDFLPDTSFQEDVCLGRYLSTRPEIKGLHDHWFSNYIPPEATTAGWEPQRVGGHFKNMGLMYEVHHQLFPHL